MSLLGDARAAVDGAAVVYNLAADMGGMGFIENNKALCMMSVLTSTHVLQAAHELGVERYFYSSSACVYAAQQQTSPDVTPLREDDAYPAMPEDGYGWEKLFSERMARHFYEDYGMQTRVARYHNVYGEYGTWDGGREKAPAAVCRKIAKAVLSGDHSHRDLGRRPADPQLHLHRRLRARHPHDHRRRRPRTRSTSAATNSSRSTSSSTSSRTSPASTSSGSYNLGAPQGVRGRNSDNTEILRRYGWAPSTTLTDGLERTYGWVYDEVKRSMS